MDFSLNAEQEAVRDLAAQIFQGHASTERVKEVESSADRVDRVLWSELAKANLLGIALPEDAGGSALGLIELCLLLEQQGRRVAPVPLWPTLVLGALPLARFGTADQRAAWLPGVAAGEVLLTAALEDATAVDADEGSGGWRLTGTKLSVPGAHVASRVLVPAGDRVFLVDPHGPGVDCQRAEATNREIVSHLHFDGAPGEALGAPGEVLSWLRPRALVGLCAIQVGVAEEALALAASYSSGRIQFGRPLSTFQGAALKAADAYIDTEAMRVTMWQAAWRLAEGHPADRDVEVAKWWASEAGQRVVHITQHLHGGMGADIEYPVHRYFLWGKQIEATLGGASRHLADLGALLGAARP
jgi:3-oxocholest-4-en-26-oyl-CoA dehydrogenase beta subunit